MPAHTPQAPSAPSPPPDPSKLRSIPEFDLYLFNNGEHRRAHRLLGAHPVEGGVRFAVWAPNAQRVSVVGSFNNWNRDAHSMERRGSTGVWERFVPDLGHGLFYKFAVQKKEGRWEFRGDPFGRMLQNDGNRTPIFAETYYEFKHSRVPMSDKFTGASAVVALQRRPASQLTGTD
jgi:1,4-alpha-glucan branching enzyme